MLTKKVLALGSSALLFLFIALLSSPADSRETRQDDLPPIDEMTWTNWGASQFAMADDGESIWIGGAGSVLEWHKETGFTQRYGSDVGLLHRKVLAVAVDGAGNRWFGGDAGLSRLAPDGVWTHYTSYNSELPIDLVDGIAVGADGTLWLSHGLPDGSISRWDPDGTRYLYPDRNAAVADAYEQVKDTRNSNDLWTVAGDEVWVGYWVYDGLSWEDRYPPNENELPLSVRTDSSDRVYALSRSVFTGAIYAWDGNNWLTYSFTCLCVATTALAVGLDDSVWVGWVGGTFPYLNDAAGISQLPEEPGEVALQQPLGAPGPVAALLPTTEGLWGIGPSWLLQPDLTATRIEDAPGYRDVTNVVRTTVGEVFLHSLYEAPYSWGAMQSVDDQGTTRLDDDAWEFFMDLPILTAAEPAPAGDLWIAGYDHYRFDEPVGPLRYHQGDWYEVELPQFETVSDIFAEDDRQTWFAYPGEISRLDDGGTPAYVTDDVWTTYPVAVDSMPSAVAVDVLGRLWYGDDSGLYFYSAMGWQPYNVEDAVCDMVPAADGTLFVQRAENCERPLDGSFSTILVVRPDGGQETKELATLVREEFERVRTASRRNGLWTVAPDGAIWYPRRYEALGVERYDGSNATFYNLPVDEGQYARWALSVDELNHVWLVADGQLWRLSPMTDFRLDAQVWLLAPGSSRQRMMSIGAIGGYSGSVSLEMSGLPSGVTATFATKPVAAGEATQLTLTADEGVALGTYEATLSGNDGVVTHMVPFTLRVVPTVYAFYGPVLAVND